MALEIGSDDQASRVPSYQEYVVASRPNSAVAFDDLTTAMAVVRAGAVDDEMMVVGHSEKEVGDRLYREPDVLLDQEWFERHSFDIRGANTVAAHAPEEMAVAQAYWSGQRDLFNSAREDAIRLNPSRENDLPAAIEFDEIRVRQQIQERGQSLELAL